MTSTAAIDLNTTNVRYLAMAASGAISLSNLYGATAILANATNVNLFTRAGSPTVVGVYKFVIFPGVTIGGSGATALTVGQFPAGSTIYIDNYGSIQGYGGSANSGVGGDAINANYANQTVVINNKAGATIYGGGGGGGKGGNGGGGYYTTTVNRGGAMNQKSVVNCNSLCSSAYGSGAYCAGNCIQTPEPAYSECTACYQTTTTYTSGGTGGNGGVGQGYNQSATTGSAGSAGGTNAGTGGTGGTGGTWGTSGATGSTGASGNNGAGSAGTVGGAAGRYLVKGSNSVTLNNSGTVAGGLA